MKPIPFDEAVARTLKFATPLGSAHITIAEASGRVLSTPLKARASMPLTAVSAMDGYAVREADLIDIPFSLPVVGESFAGSSPNQTLAPNSAMRIFTGAPLPKGADRVIVQENVERDGDTANFVRSHNDSTHIRDAGADFKAGEELLPAGQKLNWRAITTAAAADWAEIEVYQQPKLVILATGDELAAPGTAHERPGAISESVSIGISALGETHGADVLRMERLADNPEVMARATSRALQDADITVMIGGASVGDRDYSRSVFGTELEYVFPKVAMKPGKPVWLAHVGNKLVLGLPGNPTSALVTARMFLVPLLMGMSGNTPSMAYQFMQLKMADPLPPNGDRESFLRATLKPEGLKLAQSQASSAQSTLAVSDYLIRRPINAAAESVGATVTCIKF